MPPQQQVVMVPNHLLNAVNNGGYPNLMFQNPQMQQFHMPQQQVFLQQQQLANAQAQAQGNQRPQQAQPGPGQNQQRAPNNANPAQQPGPKVPKTNPPQAK